jgi:hypothetical protein
MRLWDESARAELLGFTGCGVSRDRAGSWRRGVGRGLMAAALADLAERG